MYDAAERAVATFSQTLIALVGTDGIGLLDVGIFDSLAASGAAAILSIVKSLAAYVTHRSDGAASLVDLDR